MSKKSHSERHSSKREDLPSAQHRAATPSPLRDAAETGLLARLRFFLTPWDERYEDLFVGRWQFNAFRDLMAGLVVAMVAIPLAMGFAMASGLRPEQGIVGGAVAGIAGALFGGSKYQVYGPTAAFIPVIAAAVTQHGHSFLVLGSFISGLILMGLGVARMGRYVELVPHSIIVGFTVGIAGTIAISQAGDALGIQAKLGTSLAAKISGLMAHSSEINGFAIAITILTFAITKGLLKLSVFIPAPLLSLGFCTILASTVWSGKGLLRISDRYGKIPTDFWVVTPPMMPEANFAFMGDLLLLVVSIVFVAGLESLLCSRMADRLAENKGHQFHPDKEFWGQGLVQIFVPLMNGFPHTGALARTATNIRLGAVSPLAGIFKGVLKLLLAAYMAHYLEQVPMACIGGILLYVAFNMVKPSEVRQALLAGRFETVALVYTAVTVLAFGFLPGVLSALILYAVAAKLSPGLVSPRAGDEAHAA